MKTITEAVIEGMIDFIVCIGLFVVARWVTKIIAGQYDITIERAILWMLLLEHITHDVEIKGKLRKLMGKK